MSALYFTSGSLVTAGIIMQAFERGQGWGAAIAFGVMLAVGATIGEKVAR